MRQITLKSTLSSIADTFGDEADFITPGMAHLLDLISWQDDEAAYAPSPGDWQEYAAWSRSLDGGCGTTELTPDERDLITHSMSEADYRYAEAEYDAARDCEDLWS